MKLQSLSGGNSFQPSGCPRIVKWSDISRRDASTLILAVHTATYYNHGIETALSVAIHGSLRPQERAAVRAALAAALARGVGRPDLAAQLAGLKGGRGLQGCDNVCTTHMYANTVYMDLWLEHHQVVVAAAV
jgi:hypothetical protein